MGLLLPLSSDDSFMPTSVTTGGKRCSGWGRKENQDAGDAQHEGIRRIKIQGMLSLGALGESGCRDAQPGALGESNERTIYRDIGKMLANYRGHTPELIQVTS